MGKVKKCLGCKNKELLVWQSKYCSNKCQFDSQYKKYIKNWKNSSKRISVNTKNVSKHLKRFLLEKYNHRCSICSWNKKHPASGKSPLEVDHIDGNAENNAESNLRILCPNCHALTPNFKNRNKGKGRSWRSKK